MSPGPTNHQMFSRAAQAEEALAAVEESLEEAQRTIGDLLWTLEVIVQESKKLTTEIVDFQKLITEQRKRFADL